LRSNRTKQSEAKLRFPSPAPIKNRLIGGFFVLYYRLDREFELNLIVKGEAVLLESVGTATVRSDSAIEAVNREENRVLVSYIFSVLGFDKISLRVVVSREAETVMAVNFNALTLGVGEFKVSYAAVIAVVLRKNIILVQSFDGSHKLADHAVSVKVADILFRTPAVILYVAELTAELNRYTEARNIAV
jgi:hypothetical protein